MSGLVRLGDSGGFRASRGAGAAAEPSSLRREIDVLGKAGRGMIAA